MNAPDIHYKFFGLLSILIMWVGLLFLLYRWRGDRTMSFSVHAARTKSGRIYYFLLFAAALPLFYVFIIKWFVPALHLPASFTYLATVGVLGQVVAMMVPALPGRKGRIHNTGAYLMGFMMIPLSILICFADASLFVRLIALLAVFYMLTVTVLFVAVKRSYSHYLYFQATYIALFHVVILLGTYTIGN